MQQKTSVLQKTEVFYYPPDAYLAGSESLSGGEHQAAEPDGLRYGGK